MIKQRQKTANGFLKRSHGFFRHAAILAGCLAAVLIIVGGRVTLVSTSTSLSGWTALCLTALCVGLASFNLLAERPFTSRRQMLELILGSISGLVALVMLEQNLDSAGDAFMFGTGLLLVTSLLGLSHRKSHPQVFQGLCLTQWALRLDDLLKYDLPSGTRSAIAQLIDALWRSPQDHADFIPAQNAVFADLLTRLELLIRQGDVKATAKTLDDLSSCLAERNGTLSTTIKIEYRDAGKDVPRLN